jgi:hypothetical protein
MNLLKAMEEYDENDGQDNVTEVANEEAANGLTAEEQNQIFLFMLKKKLGHEGFGQLMQSAGEDLEVYGLIDDVGQAREDHKALGEEQEHDKGHKPIMMASIKLALRDNDEEARLFLELEQKSKELVHSILERYGDQAKEAIGEMLKEKSRKALTMTGPNARFIQSALYEMANHDAQNGGQTNI